VIYDKWPLIYQLPFFCAGI